MAPPPGSTGINPELHHVHHLPPPQLEMVVSTPHGMTSHPPGYQDGMYPHASSSMPRVKIVAQRDLRDPRDPNDPTIDPREYFTLDPDQVTRKTSYGTPGDIHRDPGQVAFR